MHCIQYIATKADDVEDAHSNVKAYLENLMGEEGYGTWYDWFVTGGGRWATGDNQYNDDYTGDVAHQSSPSFEAHLAKAKEYRQAEIKSYLEKAREVNLTELLDMVDLEDEYNFKVGHQLYDIKKLYDITMGSWDYTSYFFDTENDTVVTKYMLEAIDKGEDNWYLVPVDFHF